MLKKFFFVLKRIYYKTLNTWLNVICYTVVSDKGGVELKQIDTFII